MISLLLKSRLKSISKSHSGTTTIEFAIVGSLFIMTLISVLELFLFYLYKTTVDTAISKGLEITTQNTALTNGDYISTHSRLRFDTNILDRTVIENNIPDFYKDFFITGTPTIDITQDTGTYDTTGEALSTHNSYRIDFNANWDPISPFLSMGGTIPIALVIYYNDY